MFILVALILILILGLFLRVYHIAEKSIWYDEADSVYCALKPITFIADPVICYKPLYFVMLKAWMQLAGSGPLAVRILSVIFSVAGVFLIYKLARLLFDSETGLVASFILAISAVNIFHAQQARHIALLISLSILSYIIMLLLTRLGRRYALWYILVNIALAQTHPYANAILFAQFIFLFIFYKRYMFLAVIPLFISGFLILLARTVVFEMTWWIPSLQIETLGELFATLHYGGSHYGLHNFDIGHSVLYLSRILSAIMPCLALYALKTLKSDKKNMTLLILWLAVPIICACMISYIKQVFLIKHLVYISVPYYILIARGVTRLRSQIFKIMILAVIAALTVSPLYIMYNNDFQASWRQAAEYLKQEVAPRSVIFVSTPKEMLSLFYYFKGPAFLPRLKIYGAREDQDTIQLASEQLTFVGFDERRDSAADYVKKDFIKKYQLVMSLAQKPQEAWVIFSKWSHMDDFVFVDQHLSDIYKHSERKCFNNIDMIHFYDE